MNLLRLALATLLVGSTSSAQVEIVHPGPILDPSRAVKHIHTVARFHQPLPEQYIWTANDAAVATGEKQLSQLKLNDWKVAPHAFRASFDVTAKPAVATLYIAGPRAAKVWIDGVQVADLHYSAAHHMGFGTMTAGVSAALKPGANVIAIEAIRGYGSHHHTNARKTSWLNSGEVLTAKILPAAEGVEAPAVLVTNEHWKSTLNAKEGWQQPAFDDATWPAVVSLGGIESSVDFFQWNADAGLYNWPGYLGEAPYMANYRLEPVTTQQVPQGTILDFGRELNGRILIPATAQATTIRVQLGESMGELMNAPYLGEIALTAPADTDARGPKTGFRYALIRGSDHPPNILAEGIYYPAPQIGTFESSDPVVNKIFETAVYTAHLSMQDSILDGIKRDRGRWIGDDEVINRVVLDVYGNVPLVKEGLEDAIGPAPVTGHVNGLPGYSAWWVFAESQYLLRTGDVSHARAVSGRMGQLLALMERELDSRHVYTGASGGKPFVDWAKGFSGADTPDARLALNFEYMLAFREGAEFLTGLTDNQRSRAQTDANHYEALYKEMSAAVAKYLRDPSGAYGDRWQTNAIATFGDEGTNTVGKQGDAIWKVLGRTVTGRKPTDVITPYYGDYLLWMMSAMWHTPEAMSWMKSYWGGMLENGATSFWEAWDPAWAGDDPHAKLEADDKVGYNASLSHGWSSGPASWLLERVLGVRAYASGYSFIEVHPRLTGLQWIKGSMATPYGAVRVEASERRVLVVVPRGTACLIVLPSGRWLMNGQEVHGPTVPDPEQKTVLQVPQLAAGRYEFLKQ